MKDALVDVIYFQSHKLKSLPMVGRGCVQSECKANTLLKIYVHVNIE